MLKFMVLCHDVLHTCLDVVPCFLNDDSAEGVWPFQEVVGRLELLGHDHGL